MLSPLRLAESFDSAPRGEGPAWMTGPRIRHARDEEIFGEGEPAEYVYKVIDGAVRTHRLLRDGRRQIEDFYFEEDVFGIEAGAEHRTTAEAVNAATVIMVRRAALSGLAARDGDVARLLFRMTIQGLQRSQDHVVLLGRKSASERVAGFLLDMAARVRAERRFDLPMSRLDMADYLGLTIETVSRTLTQLQLDGAIQLPSCRTVVLSDHAALVARCE